MNEQTPCVLPGVVVSIELLSSYGRLLSIHQKYTQGSETYCFWGKQ